MLNYYNAYTDTTVPFKIIIGKEELGELPENYMINPNNVLAVTKTEISSENKNKIIGLVRITKDKKTFIFSESSMGIARTSSDSEHIQHAREYLFNSNDTMITLNDIVNRVAALVNKEDAEIDLSPENLEKDTILNLMLK